MINNISRTKMKPVKYLLSMTKKQGRHKKKSKGEEENK